MRGRMVVIREMPYIWSTNLLFACSHVQTPPFASLSYQYLVGKREKIFNRDEVSRMEMNEYRALVTPGILKDLVSVDSFVVYIRAHTRQCAIKKFNDDRMNRFFGKEIIDIQQVRTNISNNYKLHIESNAINESVPEENNTINALDVIDCLCPDELNIIRLAGFEYTNPEIAKSLEMSVQDVINYKRSISRKIYEKSKNNKKGIL